MKEKMADTLLLIGDVSSDRPFLREIFESSYNILEAENVPQARLLLEHNSECVAAVLLDIPLSYEDDIRAIAADCKVNTKDEIPLLVFITPVGTGEREDVAFGLGATDVVRKPYTPAVIHRRLQVLVDLFFHKWNLEALVAAQSEAIRNTNQVMLDALSAIIEHRNTESGNHVLRIRRFTKILLQDVRNTFPEYGLTDNIIDIIASASALHDIGKIAIPDSILNKPGKLTAEEFEIMKTHTTVGGQLVENLSGMGDLEYLRYAYNIALYHHERWDGSGYPMGLKGDDIPICAQVVGIADCFDALTTHRAYKSAFPYEQAFNMIINGECGVFSHRVIECFKHVRKDFVELAARYADGHSPKSDAITMPLSGPVWQTHRLDTLQLSQAKYQTLLHHVNDTVIEMDFDSGIYHVVYNPNPNFDNIDPSKSFNDLLKDLTLNGVHPDDVDTVREMYRFFANDFFTQNLRRKTFSYRMYSPLHAAYQKYDVTHLRVNTENNAQRIVLAIYHKSGDQPEKSKSRFPSDIERRTAPLQGLLNSILCCRCDRDLIIEYGAGTLYHLCGYTKQDIEQQFGGSLFNLILPEDRPNLDAVLKQLTQIGGTGECEFRVFTKSGEPLWVIDRCRFYSGDNGEDRCYHSLSNNSRAKNIQLRLERELKRSEIIIEASDSIVFEYDILNDVFTCSSKWQDIFGYEPLKADFSKKMATASHVHPDDMPALREAAEALVGGCSALEPIELRIANSTGKYIWCKICASVQKSPDGSELNLIGTITDTDALKRATLALKERVERDALTKLLNKASTQQIITEYLSLRPDDESAALLILDLDNFKDINDRYGHLYGDAVLAQIGTSLRSLFREYDVIGRIGGDEFMILLKNIPSKKLVADRCELLLETFRDTLGALTPDLDVSCSIGAALIPAHGTGWQELYQRADAALYSAKNDGKNQYRIYDASEKLKRRRSKRKETAIESDELPGLANDRFVRFVFHCLYESRHQEDTINELLAYIGKELNVSRVYIFENNEDNTACSNTFEWCNDGIEPQIEILQNVSYITDVPGWPEVFNERGIFYCTDISTLAPQFREILEPQGIKSMLQCSIMDAGVFRGYVGFDECISNRMWTQDQINLLEFLSEVFSVFLLKKRSQDKATEQASNLKSILDNQDAWIYVIDPDSYELRFINEKAKNLAPGIGEGMVCYKVFMNRDTPCENCPAVNIRETKNALSIITNPNFDLKVRARASLISWNNRNECLITCHDTKNT